MATSTARSNRSEKMAARKAQEARMAAQHAEALHALKNGCPCCGRPVKRNLALTGWVQCVQFGADGFRADSTLPTCNWQGFLYL